ncbi:hypothetical protein [Peribacillus tepidiphilus]
MDANLLPKLQDVIRITPILTRVNPGRISNNNKKEEKRIVDQRLFNRNKV